MKRIFDVTAALVGLVVLSPIIVLLALLIRYQLGPPIFFRQERPGIHGRIFTLIKFRTMLDLTDNNGQQLSDAQRMTRFGAFLRSTSLDELPGLFNVLTGDMSVVGPRPLLVEYLPLYSEEQRRRHHVSPGITGWAQVNGRNAISWEDKFELDTWYVDHRTFWLDIKIILLTVKKVFFREGITSEGEATMKKFERENQKLVAVYGASGYGREVMHLVRQQFSGEDTVKLYFVDDGVEDSMVNGVEVISYDEYVHLLGEKHITIAIADNALRRSLQQKCLDNNVNILSIQAENSVIMDDVSLGQGVILSPFVTITSNVKVGNGFHANLYSYVAHDCIIGDFVTFAPSVKCNGNVHVEDNVYIGTGAVIKQGTLDRPVVIGEGAFIGMGAVVTKSVSPGDTVFGVPAKSIRRARA